MKQFLKWIVTSSANPSKVSATIKGVLGVAVTWLTVIFGFAHIGGADQLGSIVDGIIAFVQALAACVSAAVFLIGLIRKLELTMKGQNPTPMSLP